MESDNEEGGPELSKKETKVSFLEIIYSYSIFLCVGLSFSEIVSSFKTYLIKSNRSLLVD